MKLVVLAILGLIGLAFVVTIGYVLMEDKRHPVVTCFVIADNAPVYNNPGREFKEISRGAHGMVYVVGRKGDWCKLTDGTYMPAYCLTPARAGENIRQL